LTGLHNEFLSSARIDNQVTCYAIVRALHETSAHVDLDGITMGVLFDNEEIGSETVQGANSEIQKSTIERILSVTKLDDNELFMKTMRRSFVISCDGCHGVHPN